MRAQINFSYNIIKYSRVYTVEKKRDASSRLALGHGWVARGAAGARHCNIKSLKGKNKKNKKQKQKRNDEEYKTRLALFL